VSRNQILILLVVLIGVLFVVSLGLARHNRSSIDEVDPSALKRWVGGVFVADPITAKALELPSHRTNQWRQNDLILDPAYDVVARIDAVPFGMRSLRFRVMEGGPLEYEYRPRDAEALDIRDTIQAGQSTDELSVMKSGGTLRLKKPSQTTVIRLLDQ
jgi:hypothetical protein